MCLSIGSLSPGPEEGRDGSCTPGLSLSEKPYTCPTIRVPVTRKLGSSSEVGPPAGLLLLVLPPPGTLSPGPTGTTWRRYWTGSSQLVNPELPRFYSGGSPAFRDRNINRTHPPSDLIITVPEPVEPQGSSPTWGKGEGVDRDGDRVVFDM